MKTGLKDKILCILYLFVKPGSSLGFHREPEIGLRLWYLSSIVLKVILAFVCAFAYITDIAIKKF